MLLYDRLRLLYISLGYHKNKMSSYYISTYMRINCMNLFRSSGLVISLGNVDVAELAENS